MDKLAEAIKKQYEIQSMAIKDRNTNLAMLRQNLEGKIHPGVLRILYQTIHNYWQPIIDETTTAIRTLEELRDA